MTHKKNLENHYDQSVRKLKISNAKTKSEIKANIALNEILQKIPGQENNFVAANGRIMRRNSQFPARSDQQQPFRQPSQPFRPLLRAPPPNLNQEQVHMHVPYQPRIPVLTNIRNYGDQGRAYQNSSGSQIVGTFNSQQQQQNILEDQVLNRAPSCMNASSLQRQDQAQPSDIVNSVGNDNSADISLVTSE